MCEFHHLDPEQELRPAVLSGLRRCAFEDRFAMGPGFIFEADLTAALPWLIELRQITRVQIGLFPNNFTTPRDIPYEVFGEGGHVCLRLSTGWGGGQWGSILVTVRRPHYTWVNGGDTPGGPTQDTDILNVDLDYAASAGHIEAWHQSPAKLQAAAAGGLQATQAMAAYEFSRQTTIHYPPRHDRYAFSELFGLSAGGLTVVNA
jgi:hypothetical protein